MAWLDPAIGKACIALGLFCATTLFAAIPIVLSQRAYHQRKGVRHVLSGLSCLGGGVFLATCFLHLLPEATRKMEDALKEAKVESYFPIPFGVVICGFILVLISEQALLSCNTAGLHGHSHGGGGGGTTSDPNGLGPVPVPNYGAIHRGNVEASEDGPENMEGTMEDSDEEDRMTTVSTHGDPGSHTAFRSIVMVFALSLHSIFEGMAIGLADSTEMAVRLMGAIIIHKCVIAVTLATSLVSSSTKLSGWAIFACIGIFAAMAPLGIGIAIALDDASLMVNGTLQCIAAGTFVYITFFEILPHELNSKHTDGSRVFKVFMMLTGLGLIVGLMLALPDKD